MTISELNLNTNDRWIVISSKGHEASPKQWLSVDEWLVLWLQCWQPPSHSWQSFRYYLINTIEWGAIMRYGLGQVSTLLGRSLVVSICQKRSEWNEIFQVRSKNEKSYVTWPHRNNFCRTNRITDNTNIAKRVKYGSIWKHWGYAISSLSIHFHEACKTGGKGTNMRCIYMNWAASSRNGSWNLGQP